MCAMCEGRSFPEYLRSIEELIDKHGWALQYVESDTRGSLADLPHGRIDPAFCYTIGLTAHGHPEIVVTGRDPSDSAAILNALARRVVVGGDRLGAGMHVSAAGFDFYVVDVDRTDEWLAMANGIYSPASVRAVQAVWRDCEGVLPWEGDAPSTIVQPVLGPPPGWYDAGEW
ncbi:DUF4262 domain-containing protein [Rhodococcus sp. BP-252]|nr:DUF4262 domain-containing protein [Rhodococcus sp. BP-320]MBY6415116.1 DUF4262 domain-containing protein [Rhodococcus sp. BP-321]MBY6421439.1 DUF4262 domain-containing protein [Rhodococcus sp. BP-324]MBY6425576.1 DUF4262 domain-containing protein [Rhodococcus sp. BP-323]MBY6430012.1 DUF4262 domain-containing protein [Rhodococcus sp. BP-322]MBY6438759.1 DUF4262 domain-containing protein [Rhodococcus sp. BP-319]MBY6443721.1 DUF4262 domain-containing protein [Rhodococcus sp. BP-318]MBY644848